MPQAQATVPTEHAERYRLQLCKHFAHKVEVRDENGTGEIAFSCGVARVVSEAGQLSISVTSPTEQELTEDLHALQPEEAAVVAMLQQRLRHEQEEEQKRAAALTPPAKRTRNAGPRKEQHA